MTLDDLRTAIAGPRGSKVTLRFLREKAHDGVLDGLEFTLVLKRGSWGPEHAVLAPEVGTRHDMLCLLSLSSPVFPFFSASSPRTLLFVVRI